MFSSITIQQLRLIGGGCNGILTIVLKCFLLIIRLYPHASSSCHILRDEWWPTAAAADDSPPHTLNQPHTRSVLDSIVIARVERRFSSGTPKLPISDIISVRGNLFI